jgi:hypothetical protein
MSYGIVVGGCLAERSIRCPSILSKELYTLGISFRSDFANYVVSNFFSLIAGMAIFLIKSVNMSRSKEIGLCGIEISRLQCLILNYQHAVLAASQLACARALLPMTAASDQKSLVHLHL